MAMSEIREMLRKNLVYYFEKCGLKQNKIAEAVGVNPSAVSNWVRGKNSPDIEQIARICDLLDIKFSDLITYPVSETDVRRSDLLNNYRELNEAGRQRLYENSKDLVDSGNYSDVPVKKEA
jgi:transcriptional regulator with XRE-family HTH domain